MPTWSTPTMSATRLTPHLLFKDRRRIMQWEAERTQFDPGASQEPFAAPRR
jgi:hypothetical protein